MNFEETETIFSKVKEALKKELETLHWRVFIAERNRIVIEKDKIGGAVVVKTEVSFEAFADGGGDGDPKSFLPISLARVSLPKEEPSYDSDSSPASPKLPVAAPMTSEMLHQIVKEIDAEYEITDADDVGDAAERSADALLAAAGSVDPFAAASSSTNGSRPRRQKRHPCDLCDEAFTSKVKLKQHFKETHPHVRPSGRVREVRLKCPVCSEMFADTQQYLFHREVHKLSRPPETFKCPLCDKSFLSFETLNRHQSTHQNPAKKPPSTEPEEGELEDGELVGVDVVNSSCDVEEGGSGESADASSAGDAVGVEGTEGQNVVLETLTPQTYLCLQKEEPHDVVVAVESASIVVNPEQSRRGRRRKSDDDKWLYPCRVCGKVFSTPGNRSRHTAATHRGRKFTCKLCGKLLSGDLKTHMDSVHLKKKKICELCGKGFSNHSNLRMHYKTRHSYIPYLCKRCGKEFSSSQELSDHKSTAHKERMQRVKCPHCQQDLAKGRLKCHIDVVHRNIRFKCLLCPKEFTQKKRLRSHIDSFHEKIKLPCDYCGKQFSRLEYLKSHVMGSHGKEFWPPVGGNVEAVAALEAAEDDLSGILDESLQLSTLGTSRIKIDPSDLPDSTPDSAVDSPTDSPVSGDSALNSLNIALPDSERPSAPLLHQISSQDGNILVTPLEQTTTTNPLTYPLPKFEEDDGGDLNRIESTPQFAIAESESGQKTVLIDLVTGTIIL